MFVCIIWGYCEGYCFSDFFLRTRETEAGKLMWVQGDLGLQNETISKAKSLEIMWIWNDMQNSNFKTDHIACLPSFLVEFYRHQNTSFCLGIACSLYHPFTLLEVSIFIGQTINLQDELGKPGHTRISFNRGYNTFRFISTKSWYFSRYCKEPSTVFHYRDTLKGFPMTVEQVSFSEEWSQILPPK